MKPIVVYYNLSTLFGMIENKTIINCMHSSIINITNVRAIGLMEKHTGLLRRTLHARRSISFSLIDLINVRIRRTPHMSAQCTSLGICVRDSVSIFRNGMSGCLCQMTDDRCVPKSRRDLVITQSMIYSFYHCLFQQLESCL